MSDRNIEAERLVRLYSEAPDKLLYDAEVGDYVTPEKAAARNAIRSQRANLAAQRAIYGAAPGYMSLSMRQDKGPFSYMGDMPPAIRPPDTYGTPESTEDKFYRLAKEGAETTLYGAAGAVTGGLVGETTARNIVGAYDAVSSADLEPYAKQVKALIEQYGGISPAKTPTGMSHILGPAYDVSNAPVVFKNRKPDSPEHILSKQYPDIMVQSTPVYYNTKYGLGDGLVSEKVTPLDTLSLPELETVFKNNFTPKAAETLTQLAKLDADIGIGGGVAFGALLGDPLRLRAANPEEAADLLFGSYGMLTGTSNRAQADDESGINLLKSLAGDPLFDRIAEVTKKERLLPEDSLKLKNLGVNSQGRIKILDIEVDKSTKSERNFKAPANPLVDELQQLPPLKSDPIRTTPPRSISMGAIKGMGAGIAGEAVYSSLQEATSVPAAYVREQVAKLQGGGYIPDFSELTPEEKPAAYSNAIGLLNYGLPAGYFGSERHKREERLSKRFGEPLTNEVKVARDMMKLTMEMQNQKIIRAVEPSLVDQFKDFGLTLVESEAAAALAALL